MEGNVIDANSSKAELGGDLDEEKRNIEILREKIQSHPEMNFQTDNEFLLRFLRAEFFDQNEAFDLIKRYYKQRLEYPEFFKTLSAENYSKVLSTNYIGATGSKDRLGRTILAINSATFWDPSVTSVAEITANMLLSLERLVQERDSQTKGIIVVIDASGISFSHIRRATPSALRHLFHTTINNFPARYKNIHVVNDNWIFSILFNIIKPFLYRDLKTLFIFHGQNFEALHKHVSPDALTERFGGNLGPFDNTAWNKVLVENDCNIIQNMTYGYVQLDK